MNKVLNLFKIFKNYTEKEVPGFQLIVTEHANFADDWFQKALVDPAWSKPPALVPDEWPTLEEFTNRNQ